MSKNKICLIFPYYGKFNNYFSLFLTSALANTKIDFLFYTDDEEVLKCGGDNIFFRKSSLRDVQKRASEVLGFNCSLSRPYKLCDYKPLYNLLFDEAKKYEYWGFADTDLILGDLCSFLSKFDYSSKRILGKHGHLTIIKNDEILTKEFLLQNEQVIRSVYSSNKNFGFDEGEYSYYNIFKEKYPDSVFDFNDYFSDVRPQYNTLSRHYFTDNNTRKKLLGRKIYKFDNGKLWAFVKQDKRISKIELMYVHFQKRPMSIDKTVSKCSFYMKPNRFMTREYVNEETAFRKLAKFSLIEFLRHQRFWISFYIKHFIDKHFAKQTTDVRITP